MSSLETFQGNKVYSYDFQPVGSPNVGSGIPGVPGSTPPVQNLATFPEFFTSCSRIIGCQRVASGGVPSQPYFVNEPIALPLPPQISIKSSVADTSTYRIYWVNEVSPSLLAC
jgi:hypothetical protein